MAIAGLLAYLQILEPLNDLGYLKDCRVGRGVQMVTSPGQLQSGITPEGLLSYAFPVGQAI